MAYAELHQPITHCFVTGGNLESVCVSASSSLGHVPWPHMLSATQLVRSTEHVQVQSGDRVSQGSHLLHCTSLMLQELFTCAQAFTWCVECAGSFQDWGRTGRVL